MSNLEVDLLKKSFSELEDNKSRFAHLLGTVSDAMKVLEKSWDDSIGQTLINTYVRRISLSQESLLADLNTAAEHLEPCCRSLEKCSSNHQNFLIQSRDFDSTGTSFRNTLKQFNGQIQNFDHKVSAIRSETSDCNRELDGLSFEFA